MIPIRWERPTVVLETTEQGEEFVTIWGPRGGSIGLPVRGLREARVFERMAEDFALFTVQTSRAWIDSGRRAWRVDRGHSG